MRYPRHIRSAVATIVLVLALLGSIGSANAAVPKITHFDDSFTFTSHLCAFPIHVTTRLRGTQTLMFDQHGHVIRTLLHNDLYAVWTNQRSGSSLIERDHLFAIVYPDLSSRDIGLNYHLSLPTGRVVLVDAGRLVGDSDQNIVFEAGKHPIEDGDVAALCSALR